MVRTIVLLCLLCGQTQAKVTDADMQKGCIAVAYRAGLIMNYRWSYNDEKTEKDFERWWVDETSSILPTEMRRIATWVWKREMEHPEETYREYFNGCLEKSVVYFGGQSF